MLKSLMVSPHVEPPPDPQALNIHNFPPHEVHRLADEWEWMIVNDNVTFVSCKKIVAESREFLGSDQEHALLEDPAVDGVDDAPSTSGALKWVHETLMHKDLSTHPVLGPRGF